MIIRDEEMMKFTNGTGIDVSHDIVGGGGVEFPPIFKAEGELCFFRGC